MTLAGWLFGALVFGVVAIFRLGLMVGGLDQAGRKDRLHALGLAVILGGGFSLLTGAWFGWCVPAAAAVALVAPDPASRWHRETRAGNVAGCPDRTAPS